MTLDRAIHSIDDLTTLTPINARDRGCRGDGAADDTARFLAALDEAMSTDRALYIPTGTYLLDGATRPRISGSNVRMYGDGVGRTRLICSLIDDDQELFIVGQGTGDEISNISIEGIEFAFTAPNTVRDGTNVLRCSRVHGLSIKNCAFQYGTFGIFIDRAHGFEITGCEVSGTRADGINCNNGSDTTSGMTVKNGRIYGNHVHDTQDDAIAVGGVYDGEVNRSQPENILIWGNDIHDITTNGGGIGVYGVAGCSVFGNRITNPLSHFMSCLLEGTSTPQYQSSNVQMYGNDCTSDQAPGGGGISGPVCMFLGARGAAPVGTEPDIPLIRDVRVWGNRFVVNDRSGIWGQLHADFLADADKWPLNVTVEDNEFVFLGTPPEFDYRGINLVGFNGLTVARNKVRNFPHLGVNIVSVAGLRFLGNEVSECVGHATYAAQNMVGLATTSGDTIADVSDNELRKTSGTAARLLHIGNASSTTYAYKGNRLESTGATISTAVATFTAVPTVPTQIGATAWDKGHPLMGTAHHLWFDASNIPRYKTSAPSGATDGIVWGMRPSVTSDTGSANIAFNADSTQVRVRSGLSGNININAPTGSPTEGQRGLFRIRDDGTPRNLAWNAAYVPINGVTLPTVTTANKWHRVEMEYSVTDSEWQVFSVGVET